MILQNSSSPSLAEELMEGEDEELIEEDEDGLGDSDEEK